VKSRTLKGMRMRVRRRWRALPGAQSGLALIEFAFSLPIFMLLAMFGAEIAFLATANMRTSQVALMLADNASRLGQTDTNTLSPTITDSDINTVLRGASLQTKTLGMMQKGRIVISSLERNATGGQTIHWQRCAGVYNRGSMYGSEGKGASDNSFLGMGRGTAIATAEPGSAVMFVEVFYRYTPLFGTTFMSERVLSQEAAMVIRDNRNLSAGLANNVESSKRMTCDKYRTI